MTQKVDSAQDSVLCQILTCRLQTDSHCKNARKHINYSPQICAPSTTHTCDTGLGTHLGHQASNCWGAQARSRLWDRLRQQLWKLQHQESWRAGPWDQQGLDGDGVLPGRGEEEYSYVLIKGVNWVCT